MRSEVNIEDLKEGIAKLAGEAAKIHKNVRFTMISTNKRKTQEKSRNNQLTKDSASSISLPISMK